MIVIIANNIITIIIDNFKNADHDPSLLLLFYSQWSTASVDTLFEKKLVAAPVTTFSWSLPPFFLFTTSNARYIVKS